MFKLYLISLPFKTIFSQIGIVVQSAVSCCFQNQRICVQIQSLANFTVTVNEGQSFDKVAKMAHFKLSKIGWSPGQVVIVRRLVIKGHKYNSGTKYPMDTFT